MPEEGITPTTPTENQEENPTEDTPTEQDAPVENGDATPTSQEENGEAEGNAEDKPTTAEVEAPEAEVSTPEAEAEAPAAEESTPAAEVEAPEEEVSTPAAETETPAPEAEAETPTAEEATPATEPEAPAAETETPTAEVEPPATEEVAPAAEVEAPAEEATTPAAETPANEDATPAAEVEAPATEDASPAEVETPASETEAPAAEGESTEAEAATPDEEEVASGLLAEILGDAENFESVVEKSQPQELGLLMDAIAERGDVGEFISKVGLIKRSFEKKTDEETIDRTLLSRFNTSLARFNKKRTAYYAQRELEKEENSRIKYEILEQLKTIVQEEQVTNIKEVRALQDRWREVGWVLQKDIQPLNSTYRQYLDIFYKLRGQYQDLLSLDRKYNLEEKNKLIAAIEALIPEEAVEREVWNELSQKVKNLQASWRGIGHVPRENLDEVNGNYRNALERFYEMRSGYFELQDQARGDNATKKQELLEQLRGYAEFDSQKARDWNEATKKVLALQEEWKKIGPGPMEVNKQLWKDYRSLCDSFFDKKGKFFKNFDKQRGENLKLKIAICEKAEALTESEDWKETARVLKELQAEWKTIGPVHERHSNKIWKRFRKACDTFFDRRSQASNADRAGYEANLKTKEALIKALEALNASEDVADRVEDFRAIQSQWKATGHVPFKLKDKINNAFREAINTFFEKSKLARHEVQRLKMESSINSIQDGDARTRKIDGEIRRLRHRIRQLKEKVDQYELNIQYISKGKSGDPLRKQIQAQIDAEKQKVEDLKKKVKDLQYLLENPPGEEE